MTNPNEAWLDPTSVRREVIIITESDQCLVPQVMTRDLTLLVITRIITSVSQKYLNILEKGCLAFTILLSPNPGYLDFPKDGI